MDSCMDFFMLLQMALSCALVFTLRATESFNTKDECLYFSLKPEFDFVIVVLS